MKVIDAIARILKIEGAEFLSAYPTTPLIEAAAKAEIRPVLCRQERVGVGIADGYARVKNGKTLAVFCMQYGPGAENAFPGVATAYSDSTPDAAPAARPSARPGAGLPPVQLGAHLRLGDQVRRDRSRCGSQVADVMRRAFSLMRMGRPGPVMVEIPADVVNEEVPEALIDAYRPVKATTAGANARDVEAAARVLREARRPVIHAGQGVLYAEASDELLELAELLQAPVMTTLEGKSAFPEDHPLALGTGGPVGDRTRPCTISARPTWCSASAAASPATAWRPPSPPGKTIIHATNDERDLNKSYAADYPLLGDAQARAAPVHRGDQEPGRPPGRTRAACARSSSACGRRGSREWSAEARLDRGPDDALPRHRRVHAGGRSRARPSSRTTPAARATSSCPSTGRSRRAAISAGASRTRSAPASASSSAPSSPPPTSSASTSWATPPSA